jgi:hypothetical protein
MVPQRIARSTAVVAWRRLTGNQRHRRVVARNVEADVLNDTSITWPGSPRSRWRSAESADDERERRG